MTKSEIKEYKRQWYLKNRERLIQLHREYWNRNKDKLNEKRRKWYKENKDKKREQDRIYYQKNREKILLHVKEYYQNHIDKYKKYRQDTLESRREYNRQYWKEHKEEINRRVSKRRANNPFYRLNRNIGVNIYRSLKNNNGNKNGYHWEKLVGYTLNDLKKHLESQFRDGMSWDNYGEWHIDHIIPISWWKFNSYTDDEFKKCWALANLQPLWGKENHIKGNRIAL